METEKVTLSQAAEYLLEECRMVLPGVQALSGFQFIAVFNQRFSELSRGEQAIHYAALLLMVAAICCLMAPAAYHRQTSLRHVSERFIIVASRFLLFGMIPLALGICLDIYLIGRLIFNVGTLSAVLSSVFLCLFIFFWVLLPRFSAARQSRR